MGAFVKFDLFRTNGSHAESDKHTVERQDHEFDGWLRDERTGRPN